MDSFKPMHLASKAKGNNTLHTGLGHWVSEVQMANHALGMAAGFEVDRQQVFQSLGRHRAVGLQGAGIDRMDLVETDLPLQERLHRHFIGCIEDGTHTG